MPLLKTSKLHLDLALREFPCKTHVKEATCAVITPNASSTMIITILIELKPTNTNSCVCCCCCCCGGANLTHIVSINIAH